MKHPYGARSTSVLSPSLVYAMALACGIGVGNIYYNQPMLGLISQDFAGTFLSKLVPMVTQLGYAAGLFFLVPLGDLMERKRLIVVQFLALAAVLAAAALAPSVGALLIASVMIGIGATVCQQLVPYAAALADDENRGRTIGTVMAGLLCGILLSQVLAGFVATHIGWRAMFWLAVPLVLTACALMAVTLPKSVPTATLSYGDALKSLIALWCRHRSLRQAMLVQSGLFGSFCAFWAVLALHLREPAYRLGADVVGLFGLIGLAGVLAAPLAGRLADRKGPGFGVRLGAGVVLSAWMVLGMVPGLFGLVIGVVLLNFGVQAAMISNQHIIYGLDATAQSRLNTVFMTGMFLGGSLGSAGASAMWSLGGLVGGWSGVCLWGIGLTVSSLAFLAIGLRQNAA